MQQKLTDAAAIGNLRTAELYGLNVIDKGIESNKKNYTRFWILSKHANHSKDSNKASICFEVGHYYGALAKVLNIFSEHQINLNRILSVQFLENQMNIRFMWTLNGTAWKIMNMPFI